MTKITVELTENEIDLLIDALTFRASRHESMSRFNPKAAKPHDRTALAMRKLKGTLMLASAKALA